MHKDIKKEFKVAGGYFVSYYNQQMVKIRQKFVSLSHASNFSKFFFLFLNLLENMFLPCCGNLERIADQQGRTQGLYRVEGPKGPYTGFIS